MYAIIEDGGKQYKVQPGDTVCLEIRAISEGQTELEFDKVLLYRDEETTLVGQPTVAGVKVMAKVNGKAAGPKVYPMQFRRRKDSQRRIGHRQQYLEVEITDISNSR